MRASVPPQAPDAQPRYEGIATQRSGKMLLPFMIYPPADFSTSPFKEHEGEEMLFVHRGEVEIAFAGQTVRLAAGMRWCSTRGFRIARGRWGGAGAGAGGGERRAGRRAIKKPAFQRA